VYQVDVATITADALTRIETNYDGITAIVTEYKTNTEVRCTDHTWRACTNHCDSGQRQPLLQRDRSKQSHALTLHIPTLPQFLLSTEVARIERSVARMRLRFLRRYHLTGLRLKPLISARVLISKNLRLIQQSLRQLNPRLSSQLLQMLLLPLKNSKPPTICFPHFRANCKQYQGYHYYVSQCLYFNRY